ncbi:ES1 protein homolog, mitochondrial-like [Venturia canescens]|uniref:ES1 protein homolog, mitochondrial-like n=1 Tax=Venturia canescens TaxID=32260 RepID=UPI001C9BC0EC|nr:ES1 protein homolog, mitochondrial-like [Venturia canescens]
MLPSKVFKILVPNVTQACLIASCLHTSGSLHKTKKPSKIKGCDPTPVAIVLCGVGGLDGTEIAEAVSIAIHCSENNLLPRFYAPDIEIVGLVNHLTKKPDDRNAPRNALIEAARLARPAIQSLCECEPGSAEALIIPGGYGAARTLSDFASKGADCTVLPELRRVMEEFNCDRKPIGTLCIATSLVAKVFKGAKVTLGKEGPEEDWPYAEAIKQVKKMGAKIEFKDVTGVSYCKTYNVFSNPAWLYACATFGEVHKGIGNMISKMRKNIVR